MKLFFCCCVVLCLCEMFVEFGRENWKQWARICRNRNIFLSYRNPIRKSFFGSMKPCVGTGALRFLPHVSYPRVRFPIKPIDSSIVSPPSGFASTHSTSKRLVWAVHPRRLMWSDVGVGVTRATASLQVKTLLDMLIVLFYFSTFSLHLHFLSATIFRCAPRLDIVSDM